MSNDIVGGITNMKSNIKKAFPPQQGLVVKSLRLNNVVQQEARNT